MKKTRKGNCVTCGADLRGLSRPICWGSRCPSCYKTYKREIQAARRAADPVRAAAECIRDVARQVKWKNQSDEWKAADKERRKRYWSTRIERMRELKRASAKRYKKRNPHMHCLFQKHRSARLKSGTPIWSNRFFLDEAYSLAELRSKITGFSWHVDHVVPLISKLVCGLHAHTNVRVIPGRINASKSNRHWPDMPTVDK